MIAGVEGKQVIWIAETESHDLMSMVQREIESSGVNLTRLGTVPDVLKALPFVYDADAVVCDLVLPDLGPRRYGDLAETGLDLLRNLLRERPELPVLVVSSQAILRQDDLAVLQCPWVDLPDFNREIEPALERILKSGTRKGAANNTMSADGVPPRPI